MYITRHNFDSIYGHNYMVSSIVILVYIFINTRRKFDSIYGHKLVVIIYR